MKKLSRWAKVYPISARTIIVIGHLLLIGLAVVLSNQLSAASIYLSPLWLYFFVLLFIITSLFYPSRKNGKKISRFYTKQKTCDFITALCSFCLVCCFTQQLDQNTFSQTVNATVTIKEPLYKNPAAEKLLTAFKNGEKTNFSHKEKRIIRQEFNYQLKNYVKAKITGDKKAADQTLLIILSCIVAVGLLTLLATLACALSCNGSGAAAIIVFVIGVAAIVWALVAVLRAIRRKSEKKKNINQS